MRLVKESCVIQVLERDHKGAQQSFTQKGSFKERESGADAPCSISKITANSQDHP